MTCTGHASLEEALEDSAYTLPDRYAGPRGPSWLERWAVTQGRTVEPQPAIPAWVQAATAETSRAPIPRFWVWVIGSVACGAVTGHTAVKEFGTG